MASSTKEALSAALKKMLGVKPIDKVTVKVLDSNFVNGLQAH